MPTSHHDAHPYGRSADDVRRRDRRLRRTRRLRATQLAIFSLLAVALIAVGVYAVGELRQPAADPGQIAPKTFGAAPVETTTSGRTRRITARVSIRPQATPSGSLWL